MKSALPTALTVISVCAILAVAFVSMPESKKKLKAKSFYYKPPSKRVLQSWCQERCRMTDTKCLDNCMNMY